MKHLFILFAWLLASHAWADTPIEHMVGECQLVMERGSCRVALDPKSYAPDATILVAGVGRIPAASYVKFMSGRTDKRTNGEFEMCALVRDVCTTDWSGGDCITARALWRQYAAPSAVGLLWFKQRLFAALELWTEPLVDLP